MSVTEAFLQQIPKWQTDWQLYLTIVLLLISLFGIIGSAITIISLYIDRKQTTAISIFIGTLACSDCLFLLTEASFGIGNIIHGGFHTNLTGCIASYIAVWAGCANSLLVILMIALERYLVIFHCIYLTNFSAVMVMMTCVILCIAVSIFIPLMIEGIAEVISITPSENGCMLSWHSRNPSALTVSVLSLVLFLLTAILYAAVNARLLKNYFRKTQKVRQSSDKNQQALKDRKLIRRAVVLSGAVFIGWSPYASAILYSLFTGKPVPPMVDFLSIIFIELNSAANPVLLYFFDPKIRSNINDLLRLKK